MKTFNDLQFSPHAIANSQIEKFQNSKHATLEFENGYGISVILGACFYSNGVDTYECAVTYNGDITYNTEITSDGIGHLSEDKVSQLMAKIQNLKD